MKYLKLPKKRPEYRQNRDHSEFLQTLHTQLFSIETFHQQLLQQLQETYVMIAIPSYQLEEYIEDLQDLHHEFLPRTAYEIPEVPLNVEQQPSPQQPSSTSS